ncbi:hypothetical protein ACFFSW_30955 [Saccharothrix longispora]|uniref:Uncharacterized protein n=2 Tax=Saccharothrix longispora TaxID=33920 RepID=A0ABU1PUC6_9PSEU|nr:hypothetical protein [Saccharothrix longispora]MDR6594252.1 hypothetical protein [Saccharothrix longispora]
MTIRRRVFMAGALAAPLFGQLQAHATAQGRSLITIEEGWVQVDWTEDALAQLARFGGTPFAVEPAAIVDADRHTVRLPLRSARVDSSFTDGEGAVEGGFGVQNDEHRVVLERITRGSGDPRAFAERTVDGQLYPRAPISTGDVSEGRVTVEPGVPAVPPLPGKPAVVRVTGIPVRPTQETLDVFQEVLGEPVFTTDTVIAHVSGEGSYWPVPERGADHPPSSLLK